jgi:hypothetical protein
MNFGFTWLKEDVSCFLATEIYADFGLMNASDYFI